ncbi:hypothetical protein B0G71_8007 [Paraburkholderia sp. BL27I4N3]|uniref:hypothetical protein n=1 Tax=Paraburkholderia sp. BL27I4N3 TaxID=1938805 RepID=UPI000E243C3E|nr:hypothetical protein [Paraburkholderia sp. BL27I4N3]REE07494.1 hypothetical protein B0G71_8007 [Paraburkholderia sp. BL27I4N3]
MSHIDQQVLALPAEQWASTLDGALADMAGAPINAHKLMAHIPQLLGLDAHVAEDVAAYKSEAQFASAAGRLHGEVPA